ALAIAAAISGSSLGTATRFSRAAAGRANSAAVRARATRRAVSTRFVIGDAPFNSIAGKPHSFGPAGRASASLAGAGLGGAHLVALLLGDLGGAPLGVLRLALLRLDTLAPRVRHRGHENILRSRLRSRRVVKHRSSQITSERDGCYS